jgi:tellurite methyltransferase
MGMAVSDRERWDRKYAAGEGPVHFEPNRLLVQYRHVLRGGRALDAACGFGGSALYLAARGYEVDAIDVSREALRHARAEARRRGLHLGLVQADLDRWWLPPTHYDLITLFFYLNRALIRRLALALRPGGWLFHTSRNKGFLEIRPDFSPQYLVAAGELPRLAKEADLVVVHHADGTADEPHVSRLVAQRPIEEGHSPSRQVQTAFNALADLTESVF